MIQYLQQYLPIIFPWIPLALSIAGVIAHRMGIPFLFRIGYYHPGRIVHSNGYNYRYSCCDNGVGRSGIDYEGIRGCEYYIEIFGIEIFRKDAPNPNGVNMTLFTRILGYIPAYFILEILKFLVLKLVPSLGFTSTGDGSHTTSNIETAVGGGGIKFVGSIFTFFSSSIYYLFLASLFSGIIGYILTAQLRRTIALLNVMDKVSGSGMSGIFHPNVREETKGKIIFVHGGLFILFFILNWFFKIV